MTNEKAIELIREKTEHANEPEQLAHMAQHRRITIPCAVS
jgi:hypothetical protein